MKFQKVLAEFQDDANPADFLRYKLLKKKLNSAADEIAAFKQSGINGDTHTASEHQDAKLPLPMTPSEKEFVETLQEDVKRINDYFMEQEEEAVIRLQTLRDRRAALPEAGEAEAKALHAAFVNLHGELILLFHYSIVNYAGVMKIMKKHDKLMGTKSDRKREYLHNLLQQPFTSTESISKLVRAAEEEIRDLSPAESDRDTTATNSPEEAKAAEAKEARLLKRTRAALTMLEQLQQTAHTPSTFLPATGTATGTAAALGGDILPESKRYK